MSNLDRAIEIVQRAIEEDVKQNYAEAYKQYQNSLDYFMLAMKCRKNEKSRSLIRAKINEYLARAETLKEHLVNGEKNKKAAVANGSGGGTKKDDSSDPELEKLRGALSQAIVSEKPNVKWDDVAGLEGAKASLKEAVILPIKFPHLFTGKRTPWRGILLYGPPGTGKSYLAKAVATEAKSTFFSVSSSDLVSKWQGDSERLVKQLFELARESKPSIIFIDEIDSLAGSRNEGESEGSRRIKTEFLVQMNGGVLVPRRDEHPVAARQLPSSGASRSAYTSRSPVPEARRHMFELHVGETPCEMAPKDYRVLADQTEGFSGSDISIIVRDALMQPVRKVLGATHFKRTEDWGEDIESDELLEPPLRLADFLKSLATTRPTVTESDIKRHDEWTRESGHDGA
ncbi:P-loop containing nucleoside triphosphate hydrolase protein [Mycena olivaceomarginata]|nr:P-loop containing nucleoside triphosphate hydrolase protein [Mycena olivaceomarginata]